MKYIFISIILIINFSILSQSLNFVEHVPHSVSEDKFTKLFAIGEDGLGTIYVAGEKSKIYKYQDNIWSSLSTPNSKNKIQEITGDHSGNVYAAVENEGLWVQKNGIWKLYDNSNSDYPTNPIHGGIAWDSLSNVLWIGTNNGLIKYSNDSIELFDFETVGVNLIDDEILDLVLDSDGSLWLISHLSTLIHLKNDTFTLQKVGWNLEIYDLLFNEISLQTNGDIIIATNLGLMIYDRNKFEFIDNIDNDISYLKVDFSNNIWLSDKKLLWKFNGDNFDTYRDPFIPEFLNVIFVSSDNHIWLAGENGAIIEIIQEKPNSLLPHISEKYDFSFYPNPVKSGNYIYFDSINKKLIESIDFFNTVGKKVFSKEFSDEILINLDKGLYYITIKTKDNLISKILYIN